MILQTAKDYLTNTSSVRIAHLVQIELAGSSGVFAYMTDFQSNVTYAGQEYSAGKVISIGSVRLVQGVRNYTVQVNVAGEYQEEIDRGTTELSYEGRRINIFRAYLDSRGEIIPFDPLDNGPVKLFLGKITGITVNEDVTKGSSIVTWDCAGLLHDFEKVNGRITDDSSHRGLISSGLSTLPVPSDGAKKEAYKTDTGFQHANQTISASISYLGKETEYYLKKSWLGLKSSLREREVTVQRSVDIKTSLEARHLPVVYGVRRLPGIPVFLDAMKSDPSRMYAVYAVCEGEIDSYLDIYIDGVSAICNSATASGTTGVCLGNKQAGDTLSIYKDLSRASDRNTGWERFPYDEDFMARDSEYDQVAPAPSTAGTNHLDEFNIMAEKGSVWVKFYHGTSTQTPCPQLVTIAAGNGFLLQNQLKKANGSSWGPEYWAASGGSNGSGAALLDTAYIVMSFSITKDRTEIPNVEVVVSGKTPLVITSPSTYTRAYSLNPVWHLLDYLTNDIYGGGIDLDTEIDFQSFMDVAAQLDVQDTSYSTSYITWWKYIGWLSPTYSRAIMQCNSVLATEDSVTKNVESMLSQFSGTLNPVGGKYHLSIENDSAPVAHIDIGEVIGRVTAKDTPNKDKWNSLQASIVDPAMEWSTNQITFFDSTYLAEDNNVHKKGSAVFSYITNYYTARAWAQRTLNISRSSRVLRFVTYYKYAWLLPNNTITFTYPRMGYSSAKFRVIEVDVQPDGLVSLAIETYDSNAYVISPQSESTPPTGPGSSALPPQGLDFRFLPDASVLITIEDPDVYGVLFWDKVDSPNILRYEGWYGPTGGPVSSRTLISALPNQLATINGEIKQFELIRNLLPNVSYTFKLQIIYNFGSKSPYSILTFDTDENLTPALITPVKNFRLVNKDKDGNFIGPHATFAWDQVTSFQYQYTYQIEFLDPEDSSVILTISNIPRTEFNYTFTLENNMATYLTKTSEVGAYRVLSPRIRVVVSGSVFSEWSSL